MVGILTNVEIFFFLKDSLGKTMYYTVWSVDRAPLSSSKSSTLEIQT